ncbi:hypothetical protein Hamer_G030462, partial [Homarus americanus]
FCGKPGHKADFCWTRPQPNKVKHERLQFRFSRHETLIFSRRALRRTQTLVPFVHFCQGTVEVDGVETPVTILRDSGCLQTRQRGCCCVDLILGNDLLQQLEDDIHGVFPLCAVTQFMLLTNDHNVTPDVDNSLSLEGLFANPIASKTFLPQLML